MEVLYQETSSPLVILSQFSCKWNAQGVVYLLEFGVVDVIRVYQPRIQIFEGTVSVCHDFLSLGSVS